MQVCVLPTLNYVSLMKFITLRYLHLFRKGHIACYYLFQILFSKIIDLFILNTFILNMIMVKIASALMLLFLHSNVHLYSYEHLVKVYKCNTYTH